MPTAVLVLAVILGVWSTPAAAHTPEEKSFYLQSRIVLRLNPRDATAGNAVGTWHLEYREYDQSLAAFTRVLRHHPDNFLAATGVALITEIRDTPRAALARAEAVRNAPPGFAPFLAVVRGRLLVKLGRHAEAERVLRAHLEASRRPYGIHLWLGRIREETGRPEAAIAAYRRAIAADPSWLEPYSRISLIHKRANRPRQAAQVLAEVVHLENPSPYPNDDIRTMWGWVMRPAPGS